MPHLKRAPELAPILEAMRNDGTLADNLRKLITQFKHHKDRPLGSDAWPELLAEIG